jgi:hypothetical protein
LCLFCQMSGFYMEGFAACKFNSDCLLHEFLISRGTSSMNSNESQTWYKIPEDTRLLPALNVATCNRFQSIICGCQVSG